VPTGPTGRGPSGDGPTWMYLRARYDEPRSLGF
jgi:hypothetical protein